MKKTLLILTAALISASSFMGCTKKGEGDPGISFHTRKARVVGEWTVSKGSGATTDASGTSTWTYSDPTYTLTDASGTITANMTMTFKFEKDGTFSTEQKITGTFLTQSFSDVTTSSGKWNFTGGVGDLKKKTQLVLITESDVNTFTLGSTPPVTTTNTYTGVDATEVHDIYTLKNKEMVIKWNSSTTDASGTTSDTGEFTLVQ